MTKKTTSKKIPTANNSKFYDIIVWETRENAQGKKHIPHKVGFASQLDNGNFACKLPEGIALTGKFTVATQTKSN